MKLKRNSLNRKIWLYLIVFSVAILAFLWLFQVLFLKNYYEFRRSNQLQKTATKIVQLYNTDDLTIYDDISYDDDVCIEIIRHNQIVYLSSMSNIGCLNNDRNPNLNDLKISFIYSGSVRQSYEITNTFNQNKNLLYALKLDDNTYAFVNTSLVPIDATVSILQNQLIYVTIVVLILSFLISYFISRKISKPIVKINQSAKRMATGEYDVVFATDENICEINELTDTLNHTKNELARTDELRRDLMANVSHDLKTPLTMIKAYAEMARDLNSNNKTKRNDNLSVIIDEADRLNVLVSDILELSKLQSNIEPLHITTFDLTECIETILKRYEFLTTEEDYQFLFESSEPILIEADQRRIEQVIYNLINNAIHYTGADKQVKVQITKENFHVRVSIIDSGSGIAQKDIPYIWDKYYKTEKKHQRHFVGTGLGLSIVKNILTQHQFVYGVESNGNGTIFYFDIKNLQK